mgnify:CR=1 FL=1
MRNAVRLPPPLTQDRRVRQGARTSCRSYEVSDLAEAGAVAYRTACPPRPPADPPVVSRHAFEVVSIDYHGAQWRNLSLLRTL